MKNLTLITEDKMGSILLPDDFLYLIELNNINFNDKINIKINVEKNSYYHILTNYKFKTFQYENDEKEIETFNIIGDIIINKIENEDYNTLIQFYINCQDLFKYLFIKANKPVIKYIPIFKKNWLGFKKIVDVEIYEFIKKDNKYNWIEIFDSIRKNDILIKIKNNEIIII